MTCLQYNMSPQMLTVDEQLVFMLHVHVIRVTMNKVHIFDENNLSVTRSNVKVNMLALNLNVIML